MNAINQGRNQSSVQSDQSYANTSVEAPAYKNPLPPLDLPKFSGKKSEWESYKGMFVALVHDLPTYHPILKLQYLARSLQGEAALHLPPPPFTGDKYEGAWKALNDRYDNKKLLLSTHLSSVISCAKIKKSSLEELTRVLDRMRMTKQSIDNLKIAPERLGELWMIYHISHKLDYPTLVEWEREADKLEDFPTYDNFLKFLESRVRILEAAQTSFEDLEEMSKADSKPTASNTKPKNQVSSHQAQAKATCIMCKSGHYLFAYPKFKELTVPQRSEFYKSNKLCMNCLREGHFITKCKAPGRCFTCHGKHHTQLHREMPAKKSETPRREETPPGDHTSEVVAYTATQRSTQASNSQDTVLLGTAMVQFLDSSGHTMTVRALIDPGSEKSFISEKVLTCLKPQINKVRVEVTGVGAAVTSIARKETTLTLRSIVDQSFSSHLSFYVLDKLTQLLPRKEVNTSTWPHIKGLILVDPRFYKTEPIDCLLGVDIYTSIMQPGHVKGGPDAPLAQNTVFGWILVGRASSCVSAHSSVQVFHTYTDQSLNTTLPKFWEIEEVPNDKPFTQDEEYCEEYFSTTTTRNSDGRYVVRLPLKQNRSYEGSREITVACLLRQEKRRGRDPKLDHMYTEYMREYIRLGHMELVPPEELSRDNYYVPHHTVPCHGSSEEIRLVFNASQRDKGGVSLNDNMYTGPKLQTDIAATLIRWKFYKYVFSSDIIKMFRQILVHPDDRNWQRIVWREDPSTPIRDYRLTIVMQGTAATPFLAIRVLQQLAQDGEATHPEAAKLLRLQVYVDDVWRRR